ncbi:MAG: ribonuclease III [Patescibacteria group bacterium]
MENLHILEDRIGVIFHDKNFLLEATTHRSYLNEYPKWPVPHNERLEFLGDAVLELAVTEDLFRTYPSFPEGKLTVIRAALVNYQMLAKLAGEIGLDEFMLLSRGERADNLRAKEVILANAYEALVGAIYLDQGFPAVKKFLSERLMPRVHEILETKSYKDAKSELQEIVQERKKVTPTYRVLGESGPAHDRVFRIGVYFGEDFIAEGSGNSKQEAEIEAAKKALEKYQDNS